MKMVWIPEAPTFPGLYANKSDLGSGKIQGLHKEPSTTNIQCAYQFSTYDECQTWCVENPHPVFVPTEHGFED